MDSYPCAQGETFDGIALREYGSEIYAGQLIAANAQYAHLLRFMGGEVLVLPDMEVSPQTLPPWRRAQQRGY